MSAKTVEFMRIAIEEMDDNILEFMSEWWLTTEYKDSILETKEQFEVRKQINLSLMIGEKQKRAELIEQ